MTANRQPIPTGFDDDDIPDLSSLEWQVKFDAVPVQRGRPKADNPKVSTTIRLDPEVLDRFKADGPGWQSRINAALRKVVGLD